MKYLVLRAWLYKLTRLKIVSLPTVSATELEHAEPNPENYLQILLDAFVKQVHPKHLYEAFAAFSDSQVILILYGSLRDQVNNGGFIQLIQNGYGPNIFDNPLAADFKKWGAILLAEVVEQAGIIYKTHRDYLERPRTIPEFSKLYKDFQEFEPLETRFYEIIDDQTAIIRNYVKQHLHEFARVE